MEKKSTWLLDFRSNTYSQTGEDGIIAKMLEILPQKNKWCVEFGASDGIHASNTRNLIEKQDYSAVLIEGNKTVFKKLQNNYSENSNVITINTFVGFDKKNNLDHVLENIATPANFDFLSIDIDGNDFHVWKAVQKYRPKIVCIEFNPTIPTEVDFVQPPNPRTNQGASLLSLVKLGKEKGYELVSVLPFNAFFVRSEYYPLYEIRDNSPTTLRANLDHVTYLFTGYDGSVLLRGCKNLPWHGMELIESRMQLLPGFLRQYPGNYTRIKKMLFFVWFAVSSPHIFFKKALRRCRGAAMKNEVVKNVEGWLTPSESDFLYKTAQKCSGRGVIVEIGSWKGKSTIQLAKGSKAGHQVPVYAIDPHTGAPEHHAIFGTTQIWTFDEFKKNINDAGVSDTVHPIVDRSENVAKNWREPIEFLWIDGAHAYKLAKLDFDSWYPHLIDGGIIAYHDTVGEVKKVVKENIWLSGHFRKCGLVDLIAFGEKSITPITHWQKAKNSWVIWLSDLQDFGRKIPLPSFMRKPLKLITKVCINSKL